MASKNFYKRFDSAQNYLDHRTYENLDYLRVPPPPIVPTFSMKRFSSGEISASYYLSGSPRKYNGLSNLGSKETAKLSSKAVTKIRRAVENSSIPFCAFMTLTFNPSASELSSDGSVDQKYAKKEFIRMRQALTQRINRQIKCKLKELPEDQHEEYKEKTSFRYVWVSELQLKTKNIHFHVLLNKYFPVSWLTKIWNQGDNAVDVVKVKDSQHAAMYMTKYITKESDGRQKEPAIITGNRYSISQKVREEMRPIMIHSKEGTEAKEAKEAMKLFKKIIEDRGGIVIDSGFGMNIPKPSRSTTYRDKKTGTIKKTKGVSAMLHRAVICDFFPSPF